MEFIEFMKEFDRMCYYYKRKNECPMGCPMNGVNISQCRRIAFEEPTVAEKTVQDWAKDNPKAPSWREWLGSYGIIVGCNGELRFINKFDEEKPVPEVLWKK